MGTAAVAASAGGVLVTAAAILTIVGYNRLVTARNRVEEAWAGIDVQLRRRAELVPNLVETVRGYAEHERDLLAEVAAARAAVAGAEGRADRDRADAALTTAIGRVLAVAEAYPRLRADTNFLALQRELAAIEEELAFARRYHNAVVEDLNSLVQTFPWLLLARLFGFRTADYVRAAAEDRAVPEVRLDRPAS